MSSPTGTSTQNVTGQRVSIQSVDPVGLTATATTRYGSTCTIDLQHYVGASMVIPEINSQWYVKRISTGWILDRKLPYNQTTQNAVVAAPKIGTYQLGSADGTVQGPLFLDGSQINANAPLRLFSETLPAPASVDPGTIAYQNGAPVYNNGTAWISLTTYTVLTSSAATLTLTAVDQVVVFTGTTPGTWTLPPVAGNQGVPIIVDNRSVTTVTLVPGFGDHIYHHASVTGILIPPGGTYQVVNDGTYWNAVSAVAEVDNQWWLVNSADTTKLAQFDLSGITTGTTRSYKLPNINGVLESQANKSVAGTTVANGYLGADANGKLAISLIDATGTPSASTFLAGNGVWTAPSAQSGAIISRTSTTGVTITSGTTFPLPASYWDTLRTSTSDITVSLTAGTFTVTVAGWYLVVAMLALNTIPATNGAAINPVLIGNGGLFEQGPQVVCIESSTGTIYCPGLLMGSWIVPMAVGDNVGMGCGASAAGFKISAGDATNTTTFFSIARLTP